MNTEEQEEFEKILLKAGNWTTDQAKFFIDDIKKNGITKDKRKKYKEIVGRMNQWKKDLEKLINEGEEWKNE